jgi:uncharacterized protein (DUF1015 family)
MAEVRPLRALRYDPAVAGPLSDVIAPPYDVIDAHQRAELLARSPHNVVAIDLPQGDDPYAEAARLLAEWRAAGALVDEDEPALWTLAQEYEAPDGRPAVRGGFLCRVRVEEYGPGRIRPHERTHPGPKEDRLALTRATRANISPIFVLYSDPTGAAREALAGGGEAWTEARGDDGTLNRVGRVSDPAAIAAVTEALAASELLIADGHHRYETARVYAEEIGGDGPHRYVLACLVALEDPGLEIFPTHRLVRDTTSEGQEALAAAIRRDWEVEETDRDGLLALAREPASAGAPLSIGYMDSHFRRAFHLTLRDQAAADDALPGKPEPYRRLDTAVVEALLLQGALGLSDDDISHMRGLGYARDAEEALRLLETAEYDAAFFMRPPAIEQVREVAAAGENMPPKSTFFHPKVPTGLLLNPLDRD